MTIDSATHVAQLHGAGVRTAPRRALGVALAVAGLGVVLDQGTKALATAQLPPGDRVPLVGDLLSLTLVYNPGAAFSIGSGATWIFTVIAILASAVTIGFAVRLRDARWGIALGLILGGALGNVVDRLVRPPSFGQGHVTDFIAYGDLFVGNIADVLVVAGVAYLSLILLTKHQESTDENSRFPQSGRGDSVDKRAILPATRATLRPGQLD